MDYFICPNCGEEVKVKAKACPHCGSDDETGWSADTYLDEVDIYDDNSYSETLEKEFGNSTTTKTNYKRIIIMVITIIIILVFLLGYIS